MPRPSNPLAVLGLAALSGLCIAQQPEVGVDATEGVPEPILMRYGEHTVNSRIDTPVDLDRFQFEGEMGDEVRIIVQATSNDMDPNLQLLDPTGTVVNSGSCVNRCSFVVAHTLAMSGTYFLTLSEGGANESGPYTLQIERIPPLLNVTSLTYGVPVSDTIDRGSDVDFFTFAAEANTQIRLIVNAQSNDMDPFLDVIDSSNTVVASGNCINRCSFQVDINPVPATDQYYVLIRDGSSNESGPYSLSVNCIFGNCPNIRPSGWTNLGQGLPGSRRIPLLVGDGQLVPAMPAGVHANHLIPNKGAFMIIGFSAINQPTVGGTLVPDPFTVVSFVTDSEGRYSLSVPWPGFMPGTQLYVQIWQPDPAAVMGWASSNATLGVGQ